MRCMPTNPPCSTPPKKAAHPLVARVIHPTWAPKAADSTTSCMSPSATQTPLVALTSVGPQRIWACAESVPANAISVTPKSRQIVSFHKGGFDLHGVKVNARSPSRRARHQKPSIEKLLAVVAHQLAGVLIDDVTPRSLADGLACRGVHSMVGAKRG